MQPKFAGKKGQPGGTFSHVGEEKKPCAKCGRKNHTTEEHRGGSKKDKNSKGGKSDNKAGDTDDKKSTGGRCHACGEPGHYAKDCPEFREFLESKKKKEGASAMHAKVERYDHTTPISMVQMTVSNFLTHEDPSMIYLLNDSGTNRHVVRDSSLLWRYTRETSSLRVGESSVSLEAVGYGELRGYFIDSDGDEIPYTFGKVWHCPKGLCNAIDTMSMMHEGIASIFDKNDPNGAHLRIYDRESGRVHIIPMLESSETALPILNFRPHRSTPIYQLMTAAEVVRQSKPGITVDINEYHQGAGGHRKEVPLRQHAKKDNIKLTGKLRLCEECYVGDLSKTPIPKVSSMEVKYAGQLTFMDLTGPFPVAEPSSGFL